MSQSGEFKQFIEDQNLDLEYYTNGAQVPRYVRINPRNRPDMALLERELIEQRKVSDEVGAELADGPFVRQTSSADFLELPSFARVSALTAYSAGQVYGMDLASGQAVLSSGVQHLASRKEVVDGVDYYRAPKVLDMCCSPGMKLAYIADIQWRNTACDKTHTCQHTGEAVGIDISEHRLHTCLSILKKYAVQNASLILGDATQIKYDDDKPQSSCLSTVSMCNGNESIEERIPSVIPARDFGIITFDTNPATDDTEDDSNIEQITKKNKITRFDEEERYTEASSSQFRLHVNPISAVKNRKHFVVSVFKHSPPQFAHFRRALAGAGTLQLKMDPFGAQYHVFPKVQSQPQPAQYEIVFVDAECSHDGSLRHVQKHLATDAELLDRLFARAHLDQLQKLQKRLLFAACQLLRPGGTLVYSTCSLTTEQNEQVCVWALQHLPLRVLDAAEHIAHSLSQNNALDGKIPFQRGMLPSYITPDHPHRPYYDLITPNCLRFNHQVNTSGLFISRFTKL